MQATSEEHLDIIVCLHGVRLACMQVDEVAWHYSDNAVVEQETHTATHAQHVISPKAARRAIRVPAGSDSLTNSRQSALRRAVVLVGQMARTFTNWLLTA